VDCGVRRRGFHGDWAYSMNVRRPSPISRHRVTARVVSAMPATNAVGRAKTHQRPSLSHGGHPARQVFGPGRLVPLDRNTKVRVMVLTLALMRRTEKGKASTVP
jgi:hypothetical protein